MSENYPDDSLSINVVPLPEAITFEYGGKVRENGVLTKYGERLDRAEQNAVSSIHNMPSHIKRLVAMNGSSYDVLPQTDHGTCSPNYNMDSKKVTLPVTYCKSGIIKDENKELMLHESRHSMDNFLGSADGDGENWISEHPMFVEAYQRDLDQIEGRTDWPMDLQHYLPKSKGGEYYNVDIARREAFAEIGPIITYGRWESRDNLYKSEMLGDAPYTDAIKTMFPNTLAVAGKFDKDMAIMSRMHNKDNIGYLNEVKGYISRMPDSPDEYLSTKMFNNDLTSSMAGSGAKTLFDSHTLPMVRRPSANYRAVFVSDNARTSNRDMPQSSAPDGGKSQSSQLLDSRSKNTSPSPIFGFNDMY